MMLLLAAFLPCQDGAAKPITKLVSKIDAGMNAMLKGAAPAEAFKPWPVANADRAPKIVEEIAQAGGSSLSTLGVEFDLVFLKEGKGVYRVRTVIYASENEASFISFRGSKTESTSGLALDTFADHNAPFRETADALVAALKAKDASKLPVADAETLVKLMPNQADDIRKEVSKTAETLKATVEEFGSVSWDEVRIRLDDHIFVVRDKEGAPKGMFKCEWEHKDGKLHLELKSFRPLEK